MRDGKERLTSLYKVRKRTEQIQTEIQKDIAKKEKAEKELKK